MSANGPTIEDALFAAYMQSRPLGNMDSWRMGKKLADVLKEYMAPRVDPPPSFMMGIPIVVDPSMPEDEVRLVGKRETVVIKVGKLMRTLDYVATR